VPAPAPERELNALERLIASRKRYYETHKAEITARNRAFKARPEYKEQQRIRARERYQKNLEAERARSRAKSEAVRQRAAEAAAAAAATPMPLPVPEPPVPEPGPEPPVREPVPVGYENHVLGRQYDDMLRRLKARQEENEAYAEAAELLQEQVEVYGYDLDDEEEE